MQKPYRVNSLVFLPGHLAAEGCHSLLVNQPEAKSRKWESVKVQIKIEKNARNDNGESGRVANPTA
jgi:hypothetical protein